MCKRFEDASVIQTVASYTKILYTHHWKDTPCRAEKSPTMTKIVLLGLLSKTIVNVSYYIVGHVPRTISVSCGLFLKKGGTISCVVTGPRQPRYSRDIWKSYSVISSVLWLICMCPFLSFLSHKVYVYRYVHAGPRKYS